MAEIWPREGTLMFAMMTSMGKSASRNRALAGAVAVCLGLLSAQASAQQIASTQQIESVDPDEAYANAQTGVQSTAPPSEQVSGGIDADLVAPQQSGNQPAASPSPGSDGQAPNGPANDPASGQASGDANDGDFASKMEPAWQEKVDAQAQDNPASQAGTEADNSQTYGKDDLIGAAEGVFGKGAKGLAQMIEKLLKKQGEPNGYIVGREAGGALVFGLRYGSGTLHHKIEGERKVYWTGPSIGFDAGANAGNTFVLVYNLFDTEDLYKRFPAGEGQVYVVGGLNASYLRRGDIVLIPIRVGAGLRLGINAGYMKFSKKQRWLPF